MFAGGEEELVVATEYSEYSEDNQMADSDVVNHCCYVIVIFSQFLSSLLLSEVSAEGLVLVLIGFILRGTGQEFSKRFWRGPRIFNLNASLLYLYLWCGSKRNGSGGST